MKSILISIKPQYCELIASGQKTVEVRKSRPKLETPFKVYIYQTLHRVHNGRTYSDGKVIGVFVCRGIMQPHISLSLMAKESCLTEQELIEYSNGKTLYGWRITDLVIYEKPRKLGEFRPACGDNIRSCAVCRHSGYTSMKCLPLKRPPQSWLYVEELKP